MKREDIVSILRGWAETMKENSGRLIDLDYVVGDGDLGLTMSDGFEAAYRAADDSSDEDLGRLFYGAGKAMASAVPSTMGTLMASGLMQCGRLLKGKTELGLAELGDLLDAYMQGVMARGGAKPGDKTFVDGIFPAVETFRSGLKDTGDPLAALKGAAEAARDGAENTRGMLARHGRAASRGEQSRSILDPGAYVASLLVSSLYQTVSGLPKER